MSFLELRKKLTYTFSKYTVNSLVTGLLDLLLEIDLQNNHPPRPFWNFLIAIRWIIYEHSPSKYRRKKLKKADNKDLVKILQLVQKIEDEFSKGELAKSSFEEVFHSIINQQDGVQQDVDRYTIARQKILFENLENHEVSLSLELILDAFYLLIFCLYPKKYLLSKQDYNGRLAPEFENTFIHLHGEQNYQDFLKMITIDFSSKKSAFESVSNKTKIKNPDLFTLDFKVFEKLPLVKIRGEYRVVFRSLLNVTVRYFMYDIFKEKRGIAFTNEFGKHFEKYVSLGLDEINADYITEKEIKQKYNHQGKLVDYLIDERVVVECKGIELDDMPRIRPNRRNLRSYLNSSVIKAIKDQVLTVVELCGLQRNNTHIVIITYKDLNFRIGQDIFGRLFSNEEDTSRLRASVDSSNIFILDIEEWETLISYSKSEKLRISEILDKVRAEAANRFKMSMHLKEIFSSKPIQLDFLDAAFEALTDSVASRLKIK